MKRLVKLFTVMFMLLAMITPAKAANYTPVSGTSTEFDKYLVLDDEAVVPGVVFNYTIEGTAGKAASAGSTMEVIATNAAPHNTLPVMYQNTYANATAAGTNVNKLTFIEGEESSTTKGNDDWVELDAGEAFVKRTMKVDFTGVTFDEPGIYRYKITEVSPSAPDLGSSLSYDTQSTNKDRIRYLDVYVVDNNGALDVSAYVLHENDSTVNDTPEWGSLNDDATAWKFGENTYTTEAAAQAAADAAPQVNSEDDTKYDYNGTTYDSQAAAQAAARADIKVTAVKLDDKSSGYVNEIKTLDIEFGKEVEGNQGSKDKYFEFEVTISGLREGTILTLDVATKAETAPLANSATTYDATTMGNANAIDDKKETGWDGQQLVAPTGGTITKKFYLKDGQYIAIKGIPVGAGYAITEVNEDYKKTDGTVVATKQVLATAGDTLVNKHQDPTSGTLGDEALKKYEVDSNGTYVKKNDGTYVLASTLTTEEAAALTDQNTYTLNENVFTGYTNTRDGVIPTGVAMGIGGLAVLVAALVGFGLMRKRNAAYEE